MLFIFFKFLYQPGSFVLMNMIRLKEENSYVFLDTWAAAKLRLKSRFFT